MKFTSDIDIDVGNRDEILKHFEHIPASMYHTGYHVKHNSGVYFTDIPVEPRYGFASPDYNEAEERGYIKLDLLNMSVYSQIKSEQQLNQLIGMDPPWDKLYDRKFCERVIHVGNHYELLTQMPEAVNTIPRMAMFLSIIRPAKRHLMGLPWSEVAKTVWTKADDGEDYTFKRSHSIAYSQLVAVHMNLIHEQEK